MSFSIKRNFLELASVSLWVPNAMSLNAMLTRVANLNLHASRNLVKRCYSAAAAKVPTVQEDIVDIKEADEEPLYADKFDSTSIDKIRNKSMLNKQHRNILYDIRPYDPHSSIEWYHNTVKYKKRMLGRYGINVAGIPVGFVWPTPEEVEDLKEYERVAYPVSLREGWKIIEETNAAKKEAIRQK